MTPIKAPLTELMPPEAARQQLQQATEALSVAIDAKQMSQLLGHLEMLAKWSKVYNLTAIRDPVEMVAQHVIDSLSVVPPLMRHLRQRTTPAKLLDVGSGAGFPGLTLAIALPNLAVTCVDSVGKKVGFIRQVIAELRIENARAEHARIETLPPVAADVITSRAFASLRDFVRGTQRHLAVNGVWLALKGRPPEEEISDLGDLAEVFHVEQLTPPGVDGERCLVWMRPHPG